MHTRMLDTKTAYMRSLFLKIELNLVKFSDFIFHLKMFCSQDLDSRYYMDYVKSLLKKKAPSVKWVETN